MTHSDQIVQAAQERFNEHLQHAICIMNKPIPPDFVIGDDYMQRWWLAKITDQHDYERLGPLQPHTKPTTDYSMYLHKVTGSDDDRAPHDHPFASCSLILEGEYIEHTPIGDFHRKPGDIVYRQPEYLHWLELHKGPVWSLFLTGRKVREWGFMCPSGWVHWEDFVAAGCGET